MNDKKQTSDEQKKTSKKSKPKYREIVELWETSIENNISDVLGSYTGNPMRGVQPEQDVDDL